MDKIFVDDTNAETILGRLDRSTPDALLRSLVEELIRVHQECRGLGARLAALEVTQSVLDQVAAEPQLDPATLPRNIRIDAAFSLPAETGFHQLEYDGNGSPYRWTGPEPMFYFEILMNREAPAKLRMRYAKLGVESPVHKIACFVDGEPVEARWLRSEGEFEIHAALPARSDAGGTVVAFVCPQITSPEGSGDARKLGLAFRWMRIEQEDSIFQQAPVVEVADAPRRRRKSAQG